MLRLILLALGAMLVAYVYWSGRRKPLQGTRLKGPGTWLERVEPTIGEDRAVEIDELAPDIRDELDRLGEQIKRDGYQGELRLADDFASARSSLGSRPDSDKIERVVKLLVMARSNDMIEGPELIVAAEKVGLQFGDMDIFHRLLEGQPEKGPVFSMANVMKPGGFDLKNMAGLRTPGIAFFVTLPAPISALDAWEMMLPAAQRVAELLGAQLLDAEQNALGRQTIQHVREQMRSYDREQGKKIIRRSW